LDLEINETVINPQQELGRLRDVRCDACSKKSSLQNLYWFYILSKDFKYVGIRSLNLLAMETAESSRFLNASTISMSEALVMLRL